MPTYCQKVLSNFHHGICGLTAIAGAILVLCHVVKCLQFIWRSEPIFKWVVVTWLNSLWPSHIIWWHKSGWTLAQVMACCLTTPSHTWTDVDLLSVRSCGFHLMPLSWGDLKIAISNRLKTAFFESHPDLARPMIGRQDSSHGNDHQGERWHSLMLSYLHCFPILNLQLLAQQGSLLFSGPTSHSSSPSTREFPQNAWRASGLLKNIKHG